MAFTTTIDSSKESEVLTDEKKDMMESKFKKMDEKDDIYTAYAKLIKIMRNMKSFIGWLGGS